MKNGKERGTSSLRLSLLQDEFGREASLTAAIQISDNGANCGDPKSVFGFQVRAGQSRTAA